MGKPSWDRLDQDFGKAPDWRPSLVILGTTVTRADKTRWQVVGVQYTRHKDRPTEALVGEVLLARLGDPSTVQCKEVVALFELEQELEETMQPPTAWERLQGDVDPDLV